MDFRIFLGAFLLLGAACSSTHKSPTGPAPEYEDPPPPSWLKDGGAAPAAPATPAPAATIPVDPVPMPPPVPVGGNS